MWYIVGEEQDFLWGTPEDLEAALAKFPLELNRWLTPEHVVQVCVSYPWGF